MSPFVAVALFYAAQFLPNLDPNWRGQIAQARSAMARTCGAESSGGAIGIGDMGFPEHHASSDNDEPKARRNLLEPLPTPSSRTAARPATIAAEPTFLSGAAADASTGSPYKKAFAATNATVADASADTLTPATVASNPPELPPVGELSSYAAPVAQNAENSPSLSPTNAFAPMGNVDSLFGHIARAAPVNEPNGSGGAIGRTSNTSILASAANRQLSPDTGGTHTRDTPVNLIANGSFETHTSTTSFANWTYGATSYPAAVGGTVLNYSGGSPLTNTNYGQPAGGAVSVDLTNDSGQVFLGQAVSLVKGNTYTLAFDVVAYYRNTYATKFSAFFTSALPASGSYVDITSLAASVGFTNMNYTVPATNTSPANGMPTTWTTESEFFTANVSGTYYLTFALSGGTLATGGADAAFDRVALTTASASNAPEPATLWLFASALILVLGGATRRSTCVSRGHRRSAPRRGFTDDVVARSRHIHFV